MLNDNTPDNQINVAILPQSVELVAVEGGPSPLALILPPLEDLAEMKSLAGKGFSIKDFAKADLVKAEGHFADELSALEKKTSRYKNSPIFFNRLANLAFAAGNLPAEEYFIDKARELSNEGFFLHKKGANLIAQRRLDEAERLFYTFNLKNDLQANLRLAYFLVQKNKISEASEYIERAVDINPIDFGARLFQGAVRLLQGRYAHAINSFRIASEERPTSSSVFSNLAIAYSALNQAEKALGALRRAVALNPLNLTAVTMLADVSFKEQRNEDAVPSLRYYLQFEQNNPSVWGRLARALLEIGQYDEAIDALKRQGSITKNSALWNDLGVAYYRKNNLKKSLESFKYAMEIATDPFARDFLLPARNAALIFSKQENPNDLLKFTEMVVSAQAGAGAAISRELSDLITFRIFGLFKSGRIVDALEACESILQAKESPPHLAAWASTALLTWYSLNEDVERALELAAHAQGIVNVLPPRDTGVKERLINNVAFVHADVGNLTEAERNLSRISHLIHKDPYPTATLGLVHMRKGHLERATELYKEAVTLSFRESDKARIKQKLNVELGKYWALSDDNRARRYFTKAIAEKNGESGLVNYAKKRLKSLSSN